MLPRKTLKSSIFSVFTLVTISSFCNEVVARTSSDLNVTLPHGGLLIGRHLTSHLGRSIRAFMGIPYAEPPVGDLRFAAPVPSKPWVGERYVVEDSDICIQRDPFRRDTTVGGSEDCLYLNVYVPHFPGHDGGDEKDLLPVMVFFHGGGWECGSGISGFYGPDYLMDHDIVYVSGNFRLGALGFLSTETVDCPGNNGLKDQVEMLKWIQANIKAFGGDPNAVTIFGESAGGASVTYHMMSPLSQGLYHKAISQSGTNLNPWAQPAHKGVASKRAAKLGKKFNCPHGKDNWSEMIKCLRRKSAEDITMSLYDFFEWDTDPMIPFPPVVEPEGVADTFINTHPRDTWTPSGISVPWMAGITSEEGALKSAPLLNIPGLLEDFRKNYEKVLPIILNYDHHSQEIQDEITMKINEFYFGGSDHRHVQWSREDHHNLTNLFTDAWFLHGLDEYLRLRLDVSNRIKLGPTYVYQFDYRGASSFTEIFHGGKEHYYGVCHAEELQYLFPVGKSLFISAVPSLKDDEMRSTLTELWVNFAKTGNPTPSGCRYKKWEPATGFPIKFVQIGNKEMDSCTAIENKVGFFEKRTKLWRELGVHLAKRLTTSSKDEL